MIDLFFIVLLSLLLGTVFVVTCAGLVLLGYLIVMIVSEIGTKS